MIYLLKMVIFHGFLYVYQRVASHIDQRGTSQSSGHVDPPSRPASLEHRSVWEPAEKMAEVVSVDRKIAVYHA
jgi:hypothetical protein